jgi:Tat protein secretion system quality control protein TatD with DNase activity
MLAGTYRCAAELLGIDVEKLKRILKSNAARVFSFPPDSD